MFGRNKEIKYVAYFLKKEGQKYVKIGEKDIRLVDEKVSFQNKTFIFNTSMCTILNSGKNIIFYDYDKSEIITLIKNDMGIDAKFLDQLIVKNIIQQLVTSLKQGLSKPDKGRIATFIFVFAFGAIVGYVITISIH